MQTTCDSNASFVYDITKPAKGDNLVIYCFDRVIFGLRPSPVLPAVVIEKHTKR